MPAARSPRETPDSKGRFAELLEKMDQISLDAARAETEAAPAEAESKCVYCENAWINNLNRFNRFDNFPLHVDDALTSFRRDPRAHFVEPDQAGPFQNVVPGLEPPREAPPRKISFLQFLGKERSEPFFFEDRARGESFESASDGGEDDFGLASTKTPNGCFLETLLAEGDK